MTGPTPPGGLGRPRPHTHRRRSDGQTVSHEPYPWETATVPDDDRRPHFPHPGETVFITPWAGLDVAFTDGVFYRVADARQGHSWPWLWLAGTRVHRQTGEPIPFAAQRPGRRPGGEWIFVRATEIIPISWDNSFE